MMQDPRRQLLSDRWLTAVSDRDRLMLGYHIYSLVSVVTRYWEFRELRAESFRQTAAKSTGQGHRVISVRDTLVLISTTHNTLYEFLRRIT